MVVILSHGLVDVQRLKTLEEEYDTRLVHMDIYRTSLGLQSTVSRLVDPSSTTRECSCCTARYFCATIGMPLNLFALPSTFLVQNLVVL